MHFDQVDTTNRDVFGRRAVARRYARWHAVFEAEEELLADHPTPFAGRVLDIGIGAGRSTSVLLPMARQYMGIDLSAAMIDAARGRFPHADLRVMDMRHAPALLEGRRFDAVVIAFNAIDCIDWPDRTDLLRRLRALLAPQGLLVFSTHSLEWADAHPRRFRIPDYVREAMGPARAAPLRWMRGLAAQARWAVRAAPNFLANGVLEQRFEGYAYLNDDSEYYGLLTVYVADAAQHRALSELGYRVLARYPKGAATGAVPWSYYVCLRAGNPLTEATSGPDPRQHRGNIGT